MRITQGMEAYQFYWCDPQKDYHLCGVLPERRENPARMTQESILNWGKRNFGIKCDIEDIFFIQVTIDRNSGRILRPNHKVKFYKIFYKDYELKKRELLGVLTERRNNFRGKTQFEAGTRWARLKFGDLVKDKQAIFVVPDELDLSTSKRKFES